MNYNDWIDMAVAITKVFPPGTREIITDVKLYYTQKGSAMRLEKTVKALWDTGAQCTAINRSLEAELNLDLVTTMIITGVSGLPEETNVYVVDLSFHNDRIIPDIRVAAAGFNDPKYSMIIGMDIIRDGDFSIGTLTHDGSGNQIPPFISFSFAHPSSGNPTDYVEVIMRNRRAKDQAPKNAEARNKYLKNKTTSKQNGRKR